MKKKNCIKFPRFSMNDSTENLNNPGSNSAPKVSIVAKPKYVGNYELQQTIGEGSFAKVKLAVHRLTQQKVRDCV